jgi:putative membrane protein
MASSIVSALHVLALALGLPSVYLRGRALKGRLDRAGLGRLFAADNLWGVAAALWLVTGLLRAFGGLEKGSRFYLASPLFWTKMALFLAVVILEIWPMITFVRWRRVTGRGQLPDTSRARTLYLVNHIEMGLLVIIVFVAAFMARGFGLRP